jgi:hypothetical protein
MLITLLQAMERLNVRSGEQALDPTLHWTRDGHSVCGPLVANAPTTAAKCHQGNDICGSQHRCETLDQRGALRCNDVNQTHVCMLGVKDVVDDGHAIHFAIRVATQIHQPLHLGRIASHRSAVQRGGHSIYRTGSSFVLGLCRAFIPRNLKPKATGVECVVW